MLKRFLPLFCLLSSCFPGNQTFDIESTVSVSTKLKLMRVPLPWHEPVIRESEGDRVVLLHGLWRSHHAMDELALDLHAKGYETINLPYPSFRKSLDEIVTEVAEQLGDSDKKTHFVTHSMGGIVIRKLAHDFPNKVTGRIVMLAPPNQGSEIIDWMEDCSFVQWSLGPGGMELSSESVTQSIPGFSHQEEVGVIMGCGQNLPIFQPLLDGENDGIVTVDGGMTEGVSELIVTPTNHCFIMANPKVKAQITEFLSKGCFKQEMK